MTLPFIVDRFASRCPRCGREFVAEAHTQDDASRDTMRPQYQLEAQAEILRMAEELRERRSTAERMMEAP